MRMIGRPRGNRVAVLGAGTAPEWDAMIKPSCQNKEDWVHGMVAAVNTLGWGRWQVENVEPVFDVDREALGATTARDLHPTVRDPVIVQQHVPGQILILAAEPV